MFFKVKKHILFVVVAVGSGSVAFKKHFFFSVPQVDNIDSKFKETLVPSVEAIKL